MGRAWGGKRVVAAAVVGWLVLSASASSSQAPPDTLPPVTLSSSTFHVGDVITMSGTGCVDPDTGTGDGLAVVLRRLVDKGRSGSGLELATIRADVAADGTYEGSGTITQPMFPDGAYGAAVTCERPGATPEDRPTETYLGRTVPIEVVAPSLPDLTVRAGTSTGYVLPCSIAGGEYGAFGFTLDTPGETDLGFGVRGRFPYEDSPQEGDTVTFDVPADLPAGAFAATARCDVSEAGTSAYWAHFTVTVLGAEATAPAPVAAAGATPVEGDAAYTG